ncbi:MAG: MBL fold metallo-hydrolase [Eubacteriaceae bacterium]|nr:MBL fold metallo-hydrolase [Eubacteriaceae bacterium]
MKIISLSENTTNQESLGTEHGLSLYIETDKNKILFDTGASELFYENAQKLGVNLSDVEIAVISHGHYDHGGGLKTFLSVNSKAKVYINKRAFNKHYAKRPNGELEYIGLDQTVMPSERIILTDDYYKINDELELFSNVEGNDYVPSGNKSLLMQSADTQVEDSFAHEQNMIIHEKDKILLLAGCAHRGIVNIVSHMNVKLNRQADYVIGGFHLYNAANGKSEDKETVKKIADYLMKTKSIYYTCHCTGVESYKLLKKFLGEKIRYLSTGSQIII